MIKKLLKPALLALIVLTNSCKDDSITEPNPDPGRRDYVWTVDTLNYEFKVLYRLWASSPDDVWAISSGGEIDKEVHHFDGTKWTTGEYFLYSICSIYGFASNNIFIGGENGKIWHFDGNEWKLFTTLTKDGHADVAFDNMWGANPNDLFAFGAYPDEEGYFNNPVIAQYNGWKWGMYNTKGLFGIVEHLYKNAPDNKIYLQVLGGRNYTDSTHIYEYNNGNYTELYSNIWAQGFHADISLINGEVYFALGNRICRRVNNQFHTVLDVNIPNFYQRFWGRSRKDLFLMMDNGLAHYNGTDIKYFFNYDFRTEIFGAALFEHDVFFLIYETQTGLNLIYHGKLKE
ncbi:MAG: hypothetical protein V1720_01445 [bacterium]